MRKENMINMLFTLLEVYLEAKVGMAGSYSCTNIVLS